MRNHLNLHRRQRDVSSSPAASNSAVKDVFTDEEEEEEKTTAKATTAKAAPAKTTAIAVTTAQRSVVSVVYVTASATFDGPIGGYKTLGVDDEEEEETSTSTTEQPKTVAPTTTATKQQSAFVADVQPSTSKQQTTLRTSTGLPASINSPTGTLTSSIAVVAATGSLSRTSTSVKKSPTVASAAGATTSSTALPEASGMSSGGKAGLAIGILLLIGAVAAIALFVFKKRKDKAKREQEELENEKSAMFAASARAASTKSSANAPQLSVRPVTEFLPNLGANRASQGNVLTTMANATPNRTSPDSNRNNPFGNSAEVIDANGASPVQLNGPSGEVIVAGAGLAPGGLTRGASKRVNGASPMDYTTKNNAFMGPPSPSGTEFSQNSDASTPTPTGTGAAIAAAGGPANTAVYRVQLDFKPSMEDELELRAGQLVRLLHEYDDGWALCIRLDRSQQGVAPRTCLSTRPVKPRPQHPQQQQGQRQSPPGQRGPQGQMRANSPGMNGGPGNGNPRNSPPMGQGSRPISPNGRNSPGPQYHPQQQQGQQRPMTPQGQGRPMTPQGQGRPGSPSMNQQGQRSPPQGPSPMNPQPNNSQPISSSPPSNFGAPVGRKPVPGQAM